MRAKPRHFIVGMGGYPVSVVVTVGYRIDEIGALLQRNRLNITERDIDALTSNVSNSLRARTILFESGHALIALAEWDGSVLCHGDLAHEVFHAVAKVFRHSLGIHLTSESEEAWAYAIDDLTQSIMAKLQPPKKPAPKRNR